MDVLSKEFVRHTGTWEAGDSIDHGGCWRRCIKNIQLLIILQTIILGMYLHEEASASLGSCKLVDQTKQIPRQQYLQVA